jgi:hypothetical protein
MELPHVILLTSFDGQQGICEYGGSYADIANAIGLTSSIQSGQVSTSLYGQGDCCNGGICCTCNNCGGQIVNEIIVETSHGVMEIELMLDQLMAAGPQYTKPQPCRWGVDQCQQGQFTIGCFGSPPAGTNTAQRGRVDVLYGPFSDSTGRHPENPQGVSPYISYSLVELPPAQCDGATLASNGITLGADLLPLFVGGPTPAGLAAIVGQIFVTVIECVF